MSLFRKKPPLWRRLLGSLGPGFIAGAADDDPSGVATYSQTGAVFGYGQLWIAPIALPFMVAVQEMCGRLGIVKGRGLAAVIREKYGRGLLVLMVAALLFANSVNIGSNLGAMASTGQMLAGGNFAVWLLAFTALTLSFQIFLRYRLYARFLKYLALSLLTYVVTAFLVTSDWGAVLTATVIPHVEFSRDYLVNIVAILGTTFSPYLFFWQASEEVEEEVAEHKLADMGAGEPVFRRRDISRMRADTVVGMVFSNLIMFFIMVTTAATLGPAGIREIGSAQQAAEALRPLAGDFAYLLFATGIIGTGLLAVPVLAGSASYAVAETLGWRGGLYRKFRDAHGFYGVITIATVIGLTVNFLGVAPFQMLYYTAVLNGLAAPLLLVVILLVTSDRQVMGKFANGPVTKILGWTVTSVMAVAGVVLVLTSFW